MSTQTSIELRYNQSLPLRKVRRHTLVLLGILALTLFASLAGEFGDLMVAHVWILYKAGRAWSHAESTAGNMLLKFAGYAFFGMELGTAIALLSWMYRTQKDLRKVYGHRMRFTPMMAVIGWFIPYRCVIRPFEVMREIYAVSHHEAIDKFRPLVGGWWGFFLAAIALGILGVVAYSEGQGNSADAAISMCVVGAVDGFLYLVSGVLLFTVVFKIDRAQAVMAARGHGS